jgi:hypothetical protein
MPDASTQTEKLKTGPKRQTQINKQIKKNIKNKIKIKQYETNDIKTFIIFDDV